MFWEMTDSRIEDEYARYLAVIHLRSPSQDLGYNYQNPLRIETANQAMLIDNRIHTIWSRHPHYRN